MTDDRRVSFVTCYGSERDAMRTDEIPTQIVMEIVPRPLPLDERIEPITPDGLLEAVVQTETTGMAVRFVTSDEIFYRLHAKMRYHCQRRGLRVVYRQIRANKRTPGPYEVVMWSEKREHTPRHKRSVVDDEQVS
jgi:hypothetical protein